MDKIPFHIRIDSVGKRLCIREKSDYINELKHLIFEAQSIGKPKALYKVAHIGSKGNDFIVVDGITLRSRVLRVNLNRTNRVFPFVATVFEKAYSIKNADLIPFFVVKKAS